MYWVLLCKRLEVRWAQQWKRWHRLGTEVGFHFCHRERLATDCSSVCAFPRHCSKSMLSLLHEAWHSYEQTAGHLYVCLHVKWYLSIYRDVSYKTVIEHYPQSCYYFCLYYSRLVLFYWSSSCHGKGSDSNSKGWEGGKGKTGEKNRTRKLWLYN